VRRDFPEMTLFYRHDCGFFSISPWSSQ